MFYATACNRIIWHSFGGFWSTKNPAGTSLYKRDLMRIQSI